MPDNMNDQFELGRIPLKPLSYKNKNLASTNELLVDYEGENPTYRMYIADSTDVSILHDLTHMISQDIINSEISADPSKLKIDLEGVDEPEDLEFLMNFIYKRFVYPQNANGFRYDRDIDMVLDETAKNFLLINTDGTVALPITTIDNVLDKSGKTISDRLGNMVSTSFGSVTITPEVDAQAEFDFTYPYTEYDGLISIHVDGKLITDDKYTIVVDSDDPELGVLTITDNDIINTITTTSKIHIQFIFNTLITGTGTYEKVSGENIANGSIPTKKLARKSDSYVFNNSNTVATSAAVYNLYTYVTDKLSGISDDTIWALDSSDESNTIYINTNKEFAINEDPYIVNVALSTDKISDVTLLVNTEITQPIASDLTEDDSGVTEGDNTEEGSENVTDNESTTETVTITTTYNIIYPDGSTLTRGLAANRVLKLMVLNDIGAAIIISSGTNAPKLNRYIYNCSDRETVISYKDLEYNTDDVITVYRNGVRLFEDLDYYIDTVNEEITIFVRTEDGERIIFEALG